MKLPEEIKLVQADSCCHSGINNQARAVDITGGRAAKESNSIRHLLALRSAFDRHNSGNCISDVWILLQLNVEKWGADPSRTDCVAAYPFACVIKS
jgi:hypothetical protein